MLLFVIYYSLMILVVVTTWVNKSRLFALYFSCLFICDFSSWLRQVATHYPKPYSGIGFMLFAITTSLYLLIPALTGVFAIYSWTKKVSALPILCWLTVSLGLLWSYPDISGQKMLTAFYAYHLTGNITVLIWCLSNAKEEFSFTQGALMIGALSSVVCFIIGMSQVSVINLENWMLVTLCNCTFYAGLIVCSWINRFVRRLAP